MNSNRLISVFSLRAPVNNQFVLVFRERNTVARLTQGRTLNHSMADFHTIVTHPGGAHNDEFLACSLLLTRHAVTIVRRDPTTAELDDPTTCVVDVGHRQEPKLNNFDHHQFPKDHPPTCALSLVLLHLGLYEDARRFCDWLETAEWFDTRGPIETAKWLGTTPETLARLNSPVAGTLLRRFALATHDRSAGVPSDALCVVIHAGKRCPLGFPLRICDRARGTTLAMPLCRHA